jgi:hypothetical protein
MGSNSSKTTVRNVTYNHNENQGSATNSNEQANGVKVDQATKADLVCAFFILRRKVAFFYLI